jgi:precorrin-2/cobalt-factor-2 C20-methyltransferase
VDAIAARVRATGPGVFLTEGDPLLYSTFVYTLRGLRERHPDVRVAVVPGITSITAAAAVAGLPLAVGDERIAIIPATRDMAPVRAALRDFDTVVLLKCAPVFDALLDTLAGAGALDGTVWVRRAGRPEQQVVAGPELGRLRGRTLDYFSILIVHPRRGRDGPPEEP